MLSSACEYGLRAALYLASLRPDGYVPIRQISKELDISFPFLTKVFQQLTQADLMTSMRGPKGGVAFTRPADQITLKEIVLAIDGAGLFEDCVLGLPGCGDQKPCPIHDQWTTERQRLDAMFSSITLSDMAEDIEAFNVRLRALPA
jgi:Rrf2 family protein